jgi:hypothetical protein
MEELVMSAVSLPTIVWSGIVAAFISLAGVVLSNWSTTKRLRVQLGHDASEKQKDRLAALRKEVYVPLYADIAAAQAHLGSLASVDPTSPDFAKPVLTAISQLSRVQLVGGIEVTKHASELTAKLTETLFALTIAAKPLHEIKIDIDLADQSYDAAVQEEKRIDSEITTLRESGRPDEGRMAALHASREYYAGQRSGEATERSEGWARLNAAQPQFLEAVRSQIGELMPAQAHLLAALKTEIGVETDQTTLLAQMEANRERMERAMKATVAALAEPSSDAH